MQDTAAVAMIPGVAGRVSEWLGRELDAEPAGIAARDALARAVA